jgi:hypothetical protein
MNNNNTNNYPQLTPIASINNHLYQQSTMMIPDMNQSPNCFQSNFPNVLDIIKMESNGNSPHITHASLARALSGEVEKNNNKVLDLELKHRQNLATLTNIESR